MPRRRWVYHIHCVQPPRSIPRFLVHDNVVRIAIGHCGGGNWCLLRRHNATACEESASSCVGPYPISIPRFLVHDNVVRIAKPEVRRNRHQFHRPCHNAQNLGQIDNLNAMTCSLAHDEGMVVMHLDIAPQALNCGRGHVGQKTGLTGSLTSTIERPLERPNSTNSRSLDESTQPQQSLPFCPPPNSSTVRTESKSSPWQGYPSAVPSKQGVCPQT